MKERAVRTRKPGAAGTALTLGHIAYSNSIPVHHRILDEPGAVRVVKGEPSTLNRLLASGGIDVAPCSSVEYARNAGRYGLLPDLSISCAGTVRSILFLSEGPPETLSGSTIALPSASATSVVLLKVLLRHRWGARCDFVTFDQQREDPFALPGTRAALFIGDAALRRREGGGDGRVRTDLGAAWTAHTGLPFVYALWQTTSDDRGALTRLHRTLVDTRDNTLAAPEPVADRHAAAYGMRPAELVAYWRTLRYDLDPDLIAGLTRFYELAAELGEVPELRFAI